MYKIPEDCGYNKIFKYQWPQEDYGINMSTVTEISKIVSGRWGWYFRPKDNMDYNREDWYERQNVVVSFERRWDLILCKLMISFNK